MKTTPENAWFVYVVRCNDGTLYTGITKNLQRRLAEHNSASAGARYTRPRRPVTLIYQEQVESRSAAAKREYQLKRLPLPEKRKLIEASVTNQAEKAFIPV